MMARICWAVRILLLTGTTSAIGRPAGLSAAEPVRTTRRTATAASAAASGQNRRQAVIGASPPVPGASVGRRQLACRANTRGGNICQDRGAGGRRGSEAGERVG